MKKFLAVLLAMCLMATMPLLAMATTAPLDDNKSTDLPKTTEAAEAPIEEGTDTVPPEEDAVPEETAAPVPTEEPAPVIPPITTESSQKVSLTFDASLSTTDMSAEEETAAQGMVEFVKSLQLDISIAEAGDLGLMQMVMMAGGNAVGTVNVAFDEKTLYISGDMLPEGWIALDMAKLTEEFSDSFAQVQGMPANQEAVMQSMVTLLEQLMVAVEGWIGEHPEVVEQMPLASLPKNVDPAIAWTRLNITKEMYPAIYKAMDASLRDLAAKGELTDLDGSPVSATGYDNSAIGQMMSELLAAMDTIDIEGVIDVLSDAQGGIPGMAVDLTADDATGFLSLLRKTDENGNRAWNGQFRAEDEAKTGRVTADITASATAANAPTQRFEGAINGKATNPQAVAGQDVLATFGFSGYVEYPGASAPSTPRLFQVELLGNVIASETEQLDFTFGAYADKGVGEDTNFATNFGFNFQDGDDKVSFTTGMAIAYQAEAGGLTMPGIEGAKLYPLMEMSDAELQAYIADAQGTVMSFLIKLLAALPPSLQSQMTGHVHESKEPE